MVHCDALQLDGRPMPCKCTRV